MLALNHKRITDNFKFKRTFEFIIPKPGPGDIEINMAKVLLDVGWVPVISRFCTLLGFRSPKAQLVVKTGSNGVESVRRRANSPWRTDSKYAVDSPDA